MNESFFFHHVFTDDFDFFYGMVLVSFWRYPDPDPYRLKRIRIRPNDMDPYGSGSGSTTLLKTLFLWKFFISKPILRVLDKYIKFRYKIFLYDISMNSIILNNKVKIISYLVRHGLNSY